MTTVSSNKIPDLQPLSKFISGYDPSILIAPDVIGRIGEGVTDQFRTKSSQYDQRYFDAESKSITLRRGFELFPDFIASDVTDILDIGCGSGNTTFPLMNIAPRSVVHATDISPEMVSILTRRAEQWNISKRVLPFISNAETLSILPNSFDLIVGSSMLHHLLAPEKFLIKIVNSLRPNGLSIFFEPMKSGHLILRHFLSELATSRDYSTLIPKKIQEFFVAYMFTIDCMCAFDRTLIDYSVLDDKWMFSRKFFDDVAASLNVQYRFFSTNPTQERFISKIENLVWLGLGIQWIIPEPGRSFVKRFDDAMPKDMMDELTSEACVVFRKK